MAKIIDGKAIASCVREDIKKQVLDLKSKGITPGLAVIIVGNDPASRVYVKNKEKDCFEVKINSIEYALPQDTTQIQLINLIDELNNTKDINGILVQLPIPKHIDEKTVLNAILPSKDVDAFHPINVGKIMIGEYDFLPCTPAGVMEMLKYENIDVAGKTCVVIGRSNIVGKPMAMLLLHSNGTVTICHSKTKNLKEITNKADILVAAIGKAEFVTGDMVKDGAVVIDVGMNKNSDNKLVGDVLFSEVEKKASYITPVPGGVGPMTRAMLLMNTLKATKIQNNI